MEELGSEEGYCSMYLKTEVQPLGLRLLIPTATVGGCARSVGRTRVSRTRSTQPAHTPTVTTFLDAIVRSFIQLPRVY
jgi:hypothetical protein